MSYIHINEVDNTMLRVMSDTTEHIAFVPINSTDGPAGINYVLSSYQDLCSIFGEDANPNSLVMTSWEFAANLLLAGMPVMVRRITSYIDSDGRDDAESGLLPGVSVAKALLKVKDLTGILTPSDIEPTIQTLNWSQADLSGSLIKNDEWNVVTAGVRGNTVYVNVNNKSTGDNKYDCTLGVNADGEEFDVIRPTAGQVCITNNDVLPVKIYGLYLYTTDAQGENPATIYDARLENYTDKPQDNDMIFSDNNLIIKDEEGKIVPLSDLKLQWAESILLPDETQTKNRAYFELNPCWSITYAKNFSNVAVKIETIPEGGKTDAEGQECNTSLTIKLLSTSIDSYEIHLTTDENDDTLQLGSSFLSYIRDTSADEETVDNAKEYDKDGNVNLLKIAYRYPGSRGKDIDVTIKTIAGDGIYYRVYKNDERVESIKLVSFRYRNPNGYYATLDIQEDIKVIWELFLANFGIEFPDTGVIINQNNIVPTPLTTEYTTVEINPNLDYNNCNYMHAIYTQRGTDRTQLQGGSCPDDADVIHEVSKVYTPLKDKYLYDVSYLTNGGYVDEIIMPKDLSIVPLSVRRYIEDAMISVAESRGDCEAFPDVPLEVDVDDATDYFIHLSTSYGTAFAPWVRSALATGANKWCPPSFIALRNIAKGIKRGIDSYMPPAGVDRGAVPEAIDLAFQVPTNYIDDWQENHAQFVNPIIYINGYGINIFGQRTLYNQYNNNPTYSSALQYLNVRLVANVVKRKIFKTCIELSFEYNNLHTWLEFKTKMTELLEPLKTNQHITGYDIQMGQTTMTTNDIRSNRIRGIVSINVANLAERFDITFELQPNQVIFDEDQVTSVSTDAYGSQGYISLQ